MRLSAAAREFEDSARELGGLRGGQPNVLEALAHFLAVEHALCGQLAQIVDARTDRAEHVVQVMGDAGAHAPQRFQTLPLEQLIFYRIEGYEQQHDVRPDLDLVAEGQQMASDGQTVDLRAVLAAEVLQQIRTEIAFRDPRVAARHLGILERHGSVAAATNHGLVADLEFSACLRTSNGDQPRRPRVEQAILCRDMTRCARQAPEISTLSRNTQKTPRIAR